MPPPPNPPQELATLCSVCSNINFAAILTPRSYNPHTKKTETIYRPEYQGKGGSPGAEWGDGGWKKRKESKKSGTGEEWKESIDGRENERDKEKSAELVENEDDDEDWRWLPRIKTAFYTDLSLSTQTSDNVFAGERRAFQINEADLTRDVVDLGLGGMAGLSMRGGGQDEGEKQAKHDDTIDEWEKKADTLSEEDFDDQIGNADSLEDIEGEGEEARDRYDDESISTWSGNSHFTEVQKIDLDEQAKGKWDYCHGQLYYMGSIWDLRSRRSICDLCWWLWRHVRKNTNVKNEYLEKSRCILKLLELKGRMNDGSNREATVLNLVFMYGFKLDDPRDSGWIVNMGFAMQGTHRDVCESRSKLSEGAITPFEDKLFGQSRWREDECNYKLFREWLRVCETKHKHPLPDADGEMSIRLIDVQRKCLVEWTGPTSNVPRFMALSYVWGKARQKVMLTTRTLKKFKRHGFLECELDETIRDSMELVLNMGERYLWVDALCILQDSAEDKAIQIPQMHKVYGRSILTIVAAHGRGTDSGLPGVGKSRRIGSRFKLELEDIQVTFRTHTKLYADEDDLDISFKENYLDQTMYQSRAWTFQEGHLSTRILVWTKEQVYWECPRCTWCEETHWESDTIDFIGWRAVKDPTPMDVWQDRMNRKAYDTPYYGPQDSWPLVSSYPALIKEYTSRNLTYDADILHACTGVLNSAKQRESSDFMFGLRTKHFGNDLLFNGLKALSLRFPEQILVQSGIPSWAWASWKGTIDIANEARGNSYDLVEDLIPCDGVRCYTLDGTTAEQRNLRLINPSGGWRFEADYVRRGEGIYDLTERPHMREEALVMDQVADVPVYSQTLSLSDIQSHQAFSKILPNFHIIFHTFYCTVLLSTEFDETTMRMSQMVMAGTHKHRGGGTWANRDSIQRQLYVCKKKTHRKASPTAGPSRISSSNAHSLATEPFCPCCGTSTPLPLPDSLEQGPYIGRLPPMSKSWDPKAYLETIPDGIYRLIFMNNNQLPMIGHLLCKPVSERAAEDGEWDGEILRRVCAASGPTRILEKGEQERWGVRWGTVILG